MPNLTLVVKGRCTSTEINYQFVMRGIAADLLHAGEDYCTYKADITYLEKVMHWFCDHGDCIPGRGYADGTCLIYSIHDDVQPA